jgi:hypothetical protein
MTHDEFEFWQKAYLAALTGIACNNPNTTFRDAEVIPTNLANIALLAYRTAKATVQD